VYPSGFQIDEAPIADTTLEDTRTGLNPAAPVGSAYPVVTANINGVILSVPKFGTAPLATIGDEFEGSLCCDDPDIPGLLRYSLAGDFHHFPAFNAIQVGRKDGEKLTMIKRLGRNLIVGTDSSLYRISTLLRADQDSGFNQNRVVELIEEDFGAVNQRSAVRFTTMVGTQLAYLTSGGLRATDGLETTLLTTNLDWANTVERDRLDSAFIVNNPEKLRLELYYAEPGTKEISELVGSLRNTFQAVPTHSIHLYYDRSQIRQDGFPKITGPHPIPATAGCLVREGTRKRVYLSTVRISDYNTKIVKADGGNSWIRATSSDPVEVDILTGDYHLGGLGNESVLGNVSLHHEAGAATQTAEISRTTRREGQPDLTVSDILDVERAGFSTVSTLAYGVAESFQFGITNSDSLGEFTINFLLADATPSEDVGPFSRAT
jgi:hypothetical protein